jgi:hypothetical protein
MSWERKVDITVGDTEVIKHEATFFGSACLGAETDWSVDGKTFSNRGDAIDRAIEIEDNRDK